EAVERVAQLGGGANRAQGVVFVHRWNAEDSHHCVADELLNRAAVTLDDVLRDFEVARHHATQALGVDLLPERGRTGDVGEEDGDGLPRLPRRLEDERSATRVAEASLVAIFGPAARTRRHRASLGRAAVADELRGRAH